MAKFLYLTLTLGILIPLLAGIVVDLFVFLPFRLTPETGFVIHVSQVRTTTKKKKKKGSRGQTFVSLYRIGLLVLRI